MVTLTTLEIRGKHVTLLGSVKGLVSDGESVKETLDNRGYDILCLSISPGELMGLDEFLAEPVDVPFANPEEEIYAKVLGRFGEVEMPPPCFVKALETARSQNIKVIAIDMDDNEYTNAYCNSVSGLEWVGIDRKARKLQRTVFEAASPEEFVKAWDRKVNGSKGFKKLEKKREENMAKRILEVLNMEGGRVLVVIELERMEGVEGILNKYI